MINLDIVDGFKFDLREREGKETEEERNDLIHRAMMALKCVSKMSWVQYEVVRINAGGGIDQMSDEGLEEGQAKVEWRMIEFESWEIMNTKRRGVKSGVGELMARMCNQNGALTTKMTDRIKAYLVTELVGKGLAQR
ncbi:hypothetical protein PPACK8108_LOCUS15548 [Phakopsora pachyrhizi]|uniref:Uncharacterized protein n=1 Tax=Phakopsora pachyrhizi TaxID=170000 RepID=A0AAV0B9I6_PHAPC|nr:hypothetical protein PPACK8108_LOCUS15548 [Phakopsora pachyrhizi]